MTKSELRNGMVVQLRKGGWSMVIKDASNDTKGYNDYLVNIEDGCFIPLSNIDSTMCHLREEDEYDVIKVAHCSYVGNIIRGIKKSSDATKYDGFKVLWTRSNPKITEVESLIAKLQGQLEDAKSELEALR